MVVLCSYKRAVVIVAFKCSNLAAPSSVAGRIICITKFYFEFSFTVLFGSWEALGIIVTKVGFCDLYSYPVIRLSTCTISIRSVGTYNMSSRVSVNSMLLV